MANQADSNQWALFGYDVRSWGRLWLAAWRDFLFSPVSPLRQRFDEPALLHVEDRRVVVQGGVVREGIALESVSCEVLAVPEELYLARTITLPVAVEADLDAVLAMEISANSPFPADDTVSGWTESRRDEHSLTITFVVAARSALVHWLSADHPGRRPEDTELWAGHDQDWIAINGFGESERERLYSRRLMRIGAYVAGVVVLLFVAVGFFVLQQRVALEQLEVAQARVLSQASVATEQREALLAANAGVLAAADLLRAHPNPHLEIARLTELLGNDAYLAHFSMRGRDLRVRGRATDAATVMQLLSEQPDFSSVTAPQAITAVGNTGIEQFHLDIRLAEDATQEDAR